MKLSIVIPIYNEEATLEKIISKVENANLYDWEKEIILVNDASIDKTEVILKKYKDKHKVIHLEKNGGKGTAVMEGLKHVTGDYVVIQDADLEYNPGELYLFIKKIKENDGNVVYGSRNLHHKKRNGFFVQRFGVWLITATINVMYQQRLTDVWTCYKLFPAEAKGYFVQGRFESELLFTTALIRAGYNIHEVPISHHPRKEKEGKKIRNIDGIYALFILITERFLFIKKPDARKAEYASHVLACPECKKSLKRDENSLNCNDHGNYEIDDFNRPILALKKTLERDDKEHRSGINWLKTFLKQFPRIYYSIWHMFCPALMLVNGPRSILYYVKNDAPIILDVGSGPERIGKEFINVDIFPFPEVDIVADASSLPFADNSIDGVVSESVLEHVRDPKKMADEMSRVLKIGGYLYVSVPFIHPFHASPNDFNRWTINGLEYLFKDLEIVEKGVRSGPWSALLLFLAYFLGVLFSFGSEKVAPFLAHIFMLILGPLKYLDLIIMKLPGSHVVATHVYIIGRKKC